MHSVKYVQVSSDDVGRRVDNFLMTCLKTVPRTRIYRMIRKGEVRVNKGRIKPDYRLKVGDDVRIPPVMLLEKKRIILPPKERLAWLEEQILFENDELLVINKPSGLAVHGGTGINFGVIDALRALRSGGLNALRSGGLNALRSGANALRSGANALPSDANASGSDGPFLELVHRLDRDTSGCLMIAKTSPVLRELHQLLFEHKVEKHYTALVRGRWNKPSPFTVDLPLMKGQMQSGERMVQVDDKGKLAQTELHLVKQYANATLLDVNLHTGRTHQIRVHAAHIGHPVAGDEKYGDAQFNRQMHVLGLRRIFLHAKTLSFTLPSTGNKISVEAPLNDELLRCLRAVE